MGKKKAEEPILGWGDGNIVVKNGILYFDFMYLGARVVQTAELPDTPANLTIARKKLIVWREKMRMETFRFAKAFPKARLATMAKFAALENTVISTDPKQVLFGQYIPEWYEKVWPRLKSENMKLDKKSIVDYWLIPFFGSMSFFEINTTVMGEFICTLKQKEYTTKSGKKIVNKKNMGKQLSRRTITPIITILRGIWNDACDKYRWEMPDPFRKVKTEQMPEEEEVDECLDDEAEISEDIIQTLRFDEYLTYLNNLDTWYRPIAELWVMTGMTPSEMAGLTTAHIHKNGYLYVRSSISRGIKKKKLKNKFRRRKIKITPAIRRVLDLFLARTDGEHPITSKDVDRPIKSAFYYEWTKVEKALQLPHRRPYCLRHTFAAWALVIGIDLDRLVRLMGHGSRQMIYEVYGKYVDGLSQDREKILEYFGEKFLTEE